MSNRATQQKEVPIETTEQQEALWATEQKKEVLKDVIIDVIEVSGNLVIWLCLKTVLGLKFKFNIYIQLKYPIKTLL